MPAIFWFRRDLRLNDNAGLYHALKSGHKVLPIFIFDKNILDELSEKQDARVNFIHQSLQDIKEELAKLGTAIKIIYSTPQKAFEDLLKKYSIDAVYTNLDYEPYAIKRDKEIEALLAKQNIPFYTYKDQVIFEQDEIVKDDKTPYTVYTPYSKKWRTKINDFYLKSYPVEKYNDNFLKHTGFAIPSLKEIGFEPVDIEFPAKKPSKVTLQKYAETRDIPGIDGTTHLGIHLRFGTISIRELARDAAAINDTFLGELIWRDFFQMILAHFPKVVNNAFKNQYDNIKWRNNEAEFKQWCTGKTGYPIVDAGMRELNETGTMHNRVRMITASFLTKHLLIDWRRGEAYFAEKLLDYDLAANNGNWQWAAGCGCDAAPYFRIFSPERQTEKFDPQHKYIKKWVPEIGTNAYPEPIVVHAEARDRCLKVYKEALKND